jgi:hypothetical protein
MHKTRSITKLVFKKNRYFRVQLVKIDRSGHKIGQNRNISHKIGQSSQKLGF